LVVGVIDQAPTAVVELAGTFRTAVAGLTTDAIVSPPGISVPAIDPPTSASEKLAVADVMVLEPDPVIVQPRVVVVVVVVVELVTERTDSNAGMPVPEIVPPTSF
jgi:hypothetical protein